MITLNPTLGPYTQSSNTMSSDQAIESDEVSTPSISKGSQSIDLSNVSIVYFDEPNAMTQFIVERARQASVAVDSVLLDMRSRYEDLEQRLAKELPAIAGAEWSMFLNKDGSLRVQSSELSKDQLKRLEKFITDDTDFMSSIRELPEQLKKSADYNGAHVYSYRFEEDKFFRNVDLKAMLSEPIKAPSDEYKNTYRAMTSSTASDEEMDAISTMRKMLWSMMGPLTSYYGADYKATGEDKIIDQIGTRISLDTWV